MTTDAIEANGGVAGKRNSQAAALWRRSPNGLRMVYFQSTAVE